MMHNVALLALLTGVAALHKPSTSDMMRMTLKSRWGSDVSFDMEELDANKWEDSQEDPGGRTTMDELADARGAFAGIVIIIAAMTFGAYKFYGVHLSISDQQEEKFWNRAAPAAMIITALTLYFSVVGGIMALNKKVYNSGTKTNYPGYEGRKVAHERIDNPGERAFFAAFAIFTTAIVGLLVCLYLRKQQDVQMSRSIIMKMACRGAVAGVFATMFVEFVRLPFHDYMANEDEAVGRVCVVLLWVGFVAIMEEVLKLCAVALGLKGSENETEAALAENFQAIGICGLAAGMGFAIVENIPRMYALALQHPLAEIRSSMWGESQEIYLIDETSLRNGRVWTFIFWGLLNIQPWLTGLAAIKLAQIAGKGPIAPMNWLSALWFVVMVHFLFDLLDRSSHPVVEFIGCCTIPYVMYTFKKQWESMREDNSLLGDQA